jgi:nucleoside-diphosphate-sugar epimerase
MKIIITGGAGFIGSHLAFELVKQGHSVKIIDNLSTGTLGNIKALATFKDIATWSACLTRSRSMPHPKPTFIKGDIRNLSLLKREFKGFDYVFHQAAFVSVPKSVSMPKMCNDINVAGTLNVLKAARENSVKKVIFASSCAIYGDTSPYTKTKETHKPAPASPYALSKLIGEYYCSMYYQLYGLPTIILRYFNVYGTGQSLSSGYANVIPSFVNRIKADKQPIIYGNGTQVRDFVHVDDVARANILAMNATKQVSGQSFNIGAEPANVKRLFNITKKLFGKEGLMPIYKPNRPGDVGYIRADLSKASAMLKYQPKIDLQTGLQKCISQV